MNFSYNDLDNIHDSHVQQKARHSLSSLVKDTLKISFSEASEYLEKHGLGDFVYDTTSTHITTGLKMKDILTYIVNRAITHTDRDEILDLLVFMMKSSRHSCFTGKITNWLSVLSYYFTDISINISKYDRITSYLDYLKSQYMDDLLYDKFSTFLGEVDITDDEREAYLEALLEYMMEEHTKPVREQRLARQYSPIPSQYFSIPSEINIQPPSDRLDRNYSVYVGKPVYIGGDEPPYLLGLRYIKELKLIISKLDRYMLLSLFGIYSTDSFTETYNSFKIIQDTEKRVTTPLLPVRDKVNNTPKNTRKFNNKYQKSTMHYNKMAYKNKGIFSKNYR
jgi:hypothetical protein